MSRERPFGVIYIGSTSNLIRRSFEHREGRIEGFTSSTAAAGWSGTSRMNS